MRKFVALLVVLFVVKNLKCSRRAGHTTHTYTAFISHKIQQPQFA